MVLLPFRPSIVSVGMMCRKIILDFFCYFLCLLFLDPFCIFWIYSSFFLRVLVLTFEVIHSFTGYLLLGVCFLCVCYTLYHHFPFLHICIYFLIMFYSFYIPSSFKYLYYNVLWEQHLSSVCGKTWQNKR